MPTRERLVDRGRDRARRLRSAIGNDFKGARLSLNLSQRSVAEACGLSQGYYSLIERAMAPGVSVDDLSSIAQLLGLDLALKTFPSGPPLREAGHFALLSEFRPLVHPAAGWNTEVPLAIPGDQRAWDAMMRLKGLRIGVEAETRLRDFQALERRIALKKRDDGVDRVALLLRASRSNRTVIRELGSALRASFPVASKVALEALKQGRDPGGDCLILL